MADSTTEVAGRKVVPKHPPTIDMIKQAIREMQEPRKGCSVPAIKLWVSSHYPEVDQSRFKISLRKALTKAIEEGIVERPKSSTATGVLTGRYKLGELQKTADKKAASAANKLKATADKKAEKSESAGRSRTPKKNAKKMKTIRRSLSMGATPKAKKSKSKLKGVPARRARSHSPEATPMKSPKVAKKKAVGKKAITPTKKKAAKPAAAKSAKSPKAKAKATKKVPAKKDKSPVAKGRKKSTTKSPKKAKKVSENKE